MKAANVVDYYVSTSLGGQVDIKTQSAFLNESGFKLCFAIFSCQRICFGYFFFSLSTCDDTVQFCWPTKNIDTEKK